MANPKIDLTLCRADAKLLRDVLEDVITGEVGIYLEPTASLLKGLHRTLNIYLNEGYPGSKELII
jgi:hypothetical protein